MKHDARCNGAYCYCLWNNLNQKFCLDKLVLKGRMLKCILENSGQTSGFLMVEGDIAICPNCVRAEMHFIAHE